MPTSGNLHEGHLSLIEVARQHAEHVVVSIFVSPTHAVPDAGSSGQPRSLEIDQRRLKRAAADLIFAPDLDTMYPFGVANATTIAVPGLSEGIWNKFGPDYFGDMMSLICRLFGLVQPHVAVFGQKDYEQQLMVRRVTQDLNLPVRIICAPICRETSGLAVSSRNQELSDKERAIAPGLYETLQIVAEDLASGQRDFRAMEAKALEDLAQRGFSAEYFCIRRAENLEEPDRDCDELVVLAGVRLGEVRLTDNLIVHV